MDELTERFEQQRTRLRAVAYRMLGSMTEADDAVQEAWLRLHRADTDEVENLDAWLTTVVARVSLNMLRSRNTRREVHLPDPVVDHADGPDPEHEALLADSVGLALLVVLERRERSMSRHTLPTTVVSHPPRFSMSLVSERPRRSQASWTASSASLNEPSIL